MSENSISAARYRFEDWEEAQEYYFENGLTDGLPVVVPTEALVVAMLEHCGLAPDKVIGVEGIRQKRFTAEKVAINAVMAGCKPEYFPVVVAAVAACCERPFNLHASSVSTNGATILVLVSGPYAQQIGMNSKAGLMGNGNRANATIGRAVNLVKTNFYGSSPQGMDKSTFGHPGKVSFCFAEDLETGSWPSMATEKGFPDGASIVTVFAATPPIQVEVVGGKDPQDVLAGPVQGLLAIGPDTPEVLVVISPELMTYIDNAAWSRKQVQEFLFEHARLSAGEWMAWHRLKRPWEINSPEEIINCLPSPDRITVVPAGGDATPYADLIASWGSSRSVTKEIQIPR
jgi:hypothetical protein